MHYGASSGLELVTGVSYLMILAGFGLRNMLEGTRARLLWPWLLMAIFAICGVTRLDYAGVFSTNSLLLLVLHFTLASCSLAYGVGQLAYAFWPELFSDRDLGRPAT
ncbi:hypothetical protein GCM10023264_11180 [Sphingomonas daechungensis]